MHVDPPLKYSCSDYLILQKKQGFTTKKNQIGPFNHFSVKGRKGPVVRTIYVYQDQNAQKVQSECLFTDQSHKRSLSISPDNSTLRTI